MTEQVLSPNSLQVALLTVKVAKETVDKIRAVAAEMSWTLIQADFGNYFSTDKRPFFNQKALDAQACIAVVDFDQDPKLALQTAEYLRSNFYHKIAIIALSSASNPELLLQAMRSGCSEFLGKPYDSGEFTDTLTRLAHRWSAIITHPHDAGKTLSFFGAKGGVGTTTLAVHLGMYLVKDFKKKVLLIDNHVQLGHVALYLGMDGTHHTFHELVSNIGRLDQDLLSGFIATHSTGLDFLSSPDVYGGEENTETESVEETIEFLSGQYDFVLLDCEASFEDVNLAIIDLSSWVYLIATPEIGAIRDLSRYVDGLIQNEHTTDKLQVVITRYSARDAVTIEQIEKAIRLPIAIKISNAHADVVHAINLGQPVDSDRGSDFSREIFNWAAGLVGAKDALAPAAAKKWFVFW